MTRKCALAAVLTAVLLAVASPANAMSWGIGADLGGSIFFPGTEDGSGEKNGTATLSWPMIGVGFYQVGGVRASFTGGSPAHEFWFGTSYASQTTEGRSSNWLMLCANYQYDFAPASVVAPFVTAGAGLQNRSGSSVGATSGVFGVGVGVARRVTDGAGRLRAELRYDRQTEGTDGDAVVIREGGALGFKLGFDLWVR